MVVPPATGTNAVITVQVGADRVGTSGVTPLAGVTLQLYNGTTAPTTAVTDAWATCVSDADGDCSFVVPNTQTGAAGCIGGAGENCDRRFWIVQEGVPSGFVANPTLRTGNGDGSGSQATPYRFRTGTTLRAGNTYTSTSDFMIGSGNSNRVASGGTWQQSRTNPEPVQQCGLDVALVLDLSGSVTQSQLVSLKAAADTFADSLVGTPSQMALFSFSTVSPAVGATQNYPGLTSVSTQAGADAFKARYASWTASGGTNWDRGLAAPAQALPTYDIAVVITDGDPTFYSQPAEGPGNFNRLREVENGIFSANALKAEGTRVLAVGVGAGVSDPATALNLSAISGETAYDGTNATTADYFQVSNYSVVADALSQLALGDCAGSLSVVKQVVGADGDVSNATPGGAGWTFNASTTSTGVELPTTSATTDASSAVNFPITYEGGVTSGAVEVQEEPRDGTTLFPVGGDNAVCTNLETGASVPVDNAGSTGFTVDVATTAAVSCTVYNQAVAPASVTVNKEWVINGADPVPQGNQPSGFTSQLTLTGPDGAGATNQDWGATRPGYSENEDVTIDEDVDLQAPAIDPDLCEVSTPQIVEINGSAVDPVPVPESGYEATLAAGDNTYTIRNTVDCESRLTLAKEVEGSALPTQWDLAALPAPGTPEGQLPGPSGQAGSAAVTDQVVSAGIPYQLAESGGPPTYLQVDNRTDLQTYPLSTGSWNCIRIGSDGEQIPGFNDGLNGGVTVPIAERIVCTATNQTGLLTLAKEVVNNSGGTAVPGDFTLRATPSPLPAVPGLADVAVRGATRADAETVEVRPNHPYSLSESGIEGYDLTELLCFVEGTPQPRTEVIVRAGENVVCVFTNADNPAQLTLRKLVEAGSTGATQTPADWTLTATPQDIEGQDPVSGNGADGVTDVEVAAGSYALSESEITGFEAGSWACQTASGETVPVSDGVVTLANSADVTCTITNTAQPSTLTLEKEVVNDNGGSAEVGDWTLTADGPTTGLTGVTGDDAITGAAVEVGSYDLSESGPSGYAPQAWECVDGDASVPVEDGTVDIGLGQDVVCTVVNDDEPGTLTLVKEVVNDDGGTALPTDWLLTADGPTADIIGESGSPGVTGVEVSAGEYALSETGGTVPSGYTASAWTCEGGTLSDDTVTVANGADVTCTITNDDVPARLTLVKAIFNDNGGTAEIGDWTLTATGPTTISGVTGEEAVTDVEVSAGSYDLSESGPPGYAASDWICGPGGAIDGSTITLANGEATTCTIVNDDEPATLTLVKEVVTDNGGTAEATDWTLEADGPTPLSGVTGTEAVTGVTVNAGTYQLDEFGPPGYSATWTCEAAGTELPIDDELNVAVPNGADVTCTAVNDDVPARLTLVKEVVNDDGGTAEPEDWTLTATGPTTISGASGSAAVTSAVVDAGSYQLSEDGPAGYTASDWVCGPDGAVSADGTIRLANGDEATCTITNDDNATPPASTWTVLKTSDPPSGATVDPGDVITYTVRAGVVTGSSVDDVVVIDDLSRVLNHASFVEGSIDASAGTATVSGNRLRWTVGVLRGTQTLTYQVRVDDDVDGERLRNVVTADGAEPCPPDGPALGARAVQDDCRTTTHSTPTAGGPSQPGGPVPGLPNTGGPTLWIALAALALMAGGAWTMGWARRRATGASVEGDGVDDGV